MGYCPFDDGKVIPCFGTRDDDKYKKGRRWFGVLFAGWETAGYKAAAVAFFLLLFGGLATTGKDSRLGGLVAVGVGLACVLYAILPGVVIKRLRRRASPSLKAYWQALHAYDDNKTAAEAAKRQAARDAELRKRSYWESLNGYEFETATAEVLEKHQFNPQVTKGSGDGGVDIVVSRNGKRGVCAMQSACCMRWASHYS